MQQVTHTHSPHQDLKPGRRVLKTDCTRPSTGVCVHASWTHRHRQHTCTGCAQCRIWLKRRTLYSTCTVFSSIAMTGPTVGQEAAPQSTVFRETVCQQAVPPLGIQQSVKLSNSNDDFYSAISQATAGAQRAYKKIRSKQSTQYQQTHSHSKPSLEHCTSTMTDPLQQHARPPHTADTSTHATAYLIHLYARPPHTSDTSTHATAYLRHLYARHRIPQAPLRTPTAYLRHLYARHNLNIPKSIH